MNKTVINNFNRLKLSLYLFPLLLLLFLFLFFYYLDALNSPSYIGIQKDGFYYLNAQLGQFPQLQYNFTQIGDAFIFLSLLAVLLIYAPKTWEALLTASLVSLLFTKILKLIFDVPRPAAIFDHHTFVIVGKPLMSQTNSLPSGHAITIFTVLTVLLFAFLPKKHLPKVFWYLGFLLIGLLLIFTRVGIGAHFPFDVIIGGIIGYISGISGIFINRKYPLWTWINFRKNFPFFIVLFIVSIIILTDKILKENIIIYYFSLISLLTATLLLVKAYLKK